MRGTFLTFWICHRNYRRAFSGVFRFNQCSRRADYNLHNIEFPYNPGNTSHANASDGRTFRKDEKTICLAPCWDCFNSSKKVRAELSFPAFSYFFIWSLPEVDGEYELTWILRFVFYFNREHWWPFYFEPEIKIAPLSWSQMWSIPVSESERLN